MKNIFVVMFILVVLLMVGCSNQSNLPDTSKTATKETATEQNMIQEKPKEPSTTPQTEDTKTEKLYTGDVASLFPTRAEIDTEFKITSEKAYNTSSYFSKNNIPSTGFKEGRVMDLELFEGTSMTVGYILVFVFDTNENAKNYYDNILPIIKNEGGYKEQGVSGINADCFAEQIGNTMQGYARDVYCYKNNVFFSTELSSFRITRLTMYKDWAKVVANKIKN